MSDRRMQIGKLQSCSCAHHVWVVLREQGGGANLRLRVHSELAVWLTAKEADGGAAARRMLAGAASLMRALGHEPLAVIVIHAPRHLRLLLRFAGGGSETDVESEPGFALLAAAQLGLPIFLQVDASSGEGTEAFEPLVTEIPNIYRETLATLGLLGDASN